MSWKWRNPSWPAAITIPLTPNAVTPSAERILRNPGPRRARRASRRHSSRLALLGGVREREPAEQLTKLHSLLGRELRAEELLDVGEVRVSRGLDLPHALLGEHGVAHARVARARLLRDEAAALEPVEEPRNPRCREKHLARDVDPPHRVALREVELDQDVVVAHGQAVVGLEARTELPGRRRVSTEKPHPGDDCGIVENFLCAQYLTKQSSLAIVDCVLKYTSGDTQCPPSPPRRLHRPAAGAPTRFTRTSRSRSPTRARARSAAASASTLPACVTASSKAPPGSPASTSRTSSSTATFRRRTSSTQSASRRSPSGRATSSTAS